MHAKLLLSLLFPALLSAAADPSLLSRFARTELRSQNHASGAAVKVLGGVFVVPVYRELETGNLWRLLASISNQDYGYTNAIPLEAVIVVNNLNSPEPLFENQLTVRLLNKLARKEFPRELEGSASAGLIQQILHSKLKLHVLDQTVTSAQSIGEIRDLGTRKAIELIPPNRRRFTFVSQIDADCRVGTDFVETVTTYLSDPLLDFLLFDLHYEVEPTSPARLFQTVAFDALALSRDQTRRALEGLLPRGATPRIVTRASVIAEVGVPHKAYAEDSALIRILRDNYQGAHAFESSVTVGYRGRIDGFDSRSILHGQDRELAISAETWHFVSRLIDAENRLQKEDPLVFQLYENEYQGILAKHHAAAQRLRESLSRVVSDPNSLATELARPEVSGSLLHAPWLPSTIAAEIKTGVSPAVVLKHLEEDFPFQLETPAPTELEILARMDAFRRAHLLAERRARIGKPNRVCGKQIAAAALTIR